MSIPGLAHVRVLQFALSGVVLAGLAGCGSGAKVIPPDPDELPFVQCKLELAGEKVPGALIALHSQAKPNLQVNSTFDSTEETYRFITTADGKKRGGVPAGEYVVTVKSAPKSKIKVPSKYADPKTSGLTVTIAAGQNFLKPIQMDK